VLAELQVKRPSATPPPANATVVSSLYLYYVYLNGAGQVVEDERAWQWDVAGHYYTGMKLSLMPQHDEFKQKGRTWCGYNDLLKGSP
jgi:hypothetical protein